MEEKRFGRISRRGFLAGAGLAFGGIRLRQRLRRDKLGSIRGHLVGKPLSSLRFPWTQWRPISILPS